MMRDPMDQHLQELLTARAEKAEAALERAVADGVLMKAQMQSAAQYAVGVAAERDMAMADGAALRGYLQSVRDSLLPDPSLNAEWSLAIAIIDDALETDHPGAGIQAVVAAARNLVREDESEHNVETLIKALEALDGNAPPKTIYRHRKGMLCRIIARGLLEASMEPCVVYQELADGTYWVRPTAEFDDGRFAALDRRDG